jgi:hypothetical protein
MPRHCRLGSSGVSRVIELNIKHLAISRSAGRLQMANLPSSSGGTEVGSATRNVNLPSTSQGIEGVYDTAAFPSGSSAVMKVVAVLLHGIVKLR